MCAPFKLCWKKRYGYKIGGNPLSNHYLVLHRFIFRFFYLVRGLPYPSPFTTHYHCLFFISWHGLIEMLFHTQNTFRNNKQQTESLCHWIKIRTSSLFGRAEYGYRFPNATVTASLPVSTYACVRALYV